MANMNVRMRLERIAKDIAQVRQHVVQYSDVSTANAMQVDTLASNIVEEAARLAQSARVVLGNKQAKTLTARVRKALGFTVP